MDPPQVTIDQTRTANLASIAPGFRRAGAEPRLAEGPDDAAKAALLVLPGVGAFGASMARLAHDATSDVIRARADAGRPLLAICVGLQLLCRSSEESPGVNGLGIVPADVRRFDAALRVPQLGWNVVAPEASHTATRPGFAYFANSYRVAEAPAGWEVAWSDYGGRFVAALQRGPLLACQFHPELSGPWGIELLQRWIHGGVCTC